MKLVFDTNVLFLLSSPTGFAPVSTKNASSGRRITVLHHILRALEDKLRSKARFSASEARAIIRAVRADAVLVKVANLARPVCRDADDDLILATALAANAAAIVTGDQDLFVLKRFQGIPILNPRECLALLATTS